MALAYKELEAPLKAYFNYVLTRFPVDVTKLKIRPIKTTKLSLADLENVPDGVKYITIFRYNFNNELFDGTTSIRTEDSRFISHHFDINENPNALANLVIGELNEGKLKPQVKESIVKGLDRFVEEGFFEFECSSSNGLEFIYYV
jgi:hypothetical protein|nr:MAG TPA: hypothetical protein [Caudoviricetes sp.]